MNEECTKKNLREESKLLMTALNVLIKFRMVNYSVAVPVASEQKQ